MRIKSLLEYHFSQYTQWHGHAVAEFGADAWAVEDNTNLGDTNNPSARPIWKGFKSYGHTRNVIATDVKSRGAWSESPCTHIYFHSSHSKNLSEHRFKFWRIQHLPGRGGGAYVTGMQHHTRPKRDRARVRHPVEGSCFSDLRLDFDGASIYDMLKRYRSKNRSQQAY